MKLADLITQLRSLQAIHGGDVDVERAVFDVEGDYELPVAQCELTENKEGKSIILLS